MKRNAVKRRGGSLTLLVAIPVSVLLLIIGGTILKIDASFGPVNVGDYSLSGPRTWTSFHGPAHMVLNVGGYKLWKRQDPPVDDGT